MLSFLLFLSVRISAVIYPVKVLFSIMEPALHRLMKRRGIDFHPIGEAVDSYGTRRIPYLAYASELFKQTEPSMGEITRYYLRRMSDPSYGLEAFIKNHPYIPYEQTTLKQLKNTIGNEELTYEKMIELTGYHRHSCR